MQAGTRHQHFIPDTNLREKAQDKKGAALELSLFISVTIYLAAGGTIKPHGPCQPENPTRSDGRWDKAGGRALHLYSGSEVPGGQVSDWCGGEGW